MAETIITKTIIIDSIADISRLVALANYCPTDVFAYRGSKMSVSAKSLMGMFALDPSQPFIIEYPADAKNLDAFITPFEVKA